MYQFPVTLSAPNFKLPGPLAVSLKDKGFYKGYFQPNKGFSRINFVQKKEHLMVKFLGRSQAKELHIIASQAKQGEKLQRKSDIFIFKW